jgi:hypothetical protein
MLLCFEKSYWKYFDDSTEEWKERDKKRQKEIEFFKMIVKEKENINWTTINPFKFI